MTLARGGFEQFGKTTKRAAFLAEMDKVRDFDTGILAGKINWSATDRDGVKEAAVAGFVNGKPTVLKSWGKPLFERP